MGPEADEEPPCCRRIAVYAERGPSEMWATLRIDSRGPAALPAGVLPVVAGVLRLPGSLPLLRLLCRCVFGSFISPFRPCRRLGRLSSRRGSCCCRRGHWAGYPGGSLPASPSQRSPSESVTYGPPMLVGLVGDVRSAKYSTWNFFVAWVCGWREPGWFLIRLLWKLPCGPAMGSRLSS